MLITVNYFAQASNPWDSVGIRGGRRPTLVAAVHERHGRRSNICDAEGAVVPWVVVDVGGRVERDPDHLPTVTVSVLPPSAADEGRGQRRDHGGTETEATDRRTSAARGLDARPGIGTGTTAWSDGVVSLRRARARLMAAGVGGLIIAPT